MKETIIKYISIVGVCLYILAVFFNPSGPQWAEKSHDVSDITMSNPINQVFYSFIFILVIFSVAPHYKKFFIWFNHEKYILLFLLWCGITIIFAIDPFVSFKRYFQYILTSLVFISFYLNIKDEQSLIKILKYLFSLYVILTLIVCLIIPEAKDPSFNSWRGFHATKNNLGQYAGISIIFFSYLHLINKTKLEKIYNLFFLVLSFLLLIGSFSMTNIVLITLFIAFFIVINSKKIFEPLRLSQKFFFLMVVFFVLMFLSIILVNPELFSLFFEITGKDPTLTGRTEIWALVLSQSINDLITGVGFQSFWIPEKLSKIILFQYWMPNQSHNGYVDMILEIGIVGLLLFIFLVYSIFKGMNFRSSGLWISIIIFVLLLNFSESTLIRPHHFTNVMFYCAFWTLSFRKYHRNFTRYDLGN
ncbi:O-antigen ligase family protein [Ignavibacterium album]|uniref:O-antigen ligase family protein n=1 Tax=Ignavibacterium album TaxID=591197 RepID=UPI0035B6C11B